MEFSEQGKKEFEKIISKAVTKQSALISTLHIAQREFGYITPEAMDYVAKLVDLSPARVQGAVTFYTMFYTKPVGKYVLQVCSTLSCALRSSESLFDHISKKLGISKGETTKDGRFTLVKVECLGSCGTSPVMQVNEDYHENLTLEKVDQLLESLK